MARRKRKRRSRGLLIIIALALLIAGFIVRRTLIPQLLHSLAYRPPAKPSLLPLSPTPLPETASRPPASEPSAAPAVTPIPHRTTPAPREHLTESDRQQLEEILKRKAK